MSFVKMDIRILLLLALFWNSGDCAAAGTGKASQSLDLGGNEARFQSMGKIVAKLSPCAGPYNDCCTIDPEQAQNPDTTFIYPSYLTQYFYICVENRETGTLEPEFFRCPFDVTDEGYYEGLFNADDSVGCYLAPVEAQRKRRPTI